MTNIDRKPPKSAPRQLNEAQSELAETHPHTAETAAETWRRKRQLGRTVLSCWSGGSATPSSARWDANRVAGLRVYGHRGARRTATLATDSRN